MITESTLVLIGLVEGSLLAVAALVLLGRGSHRRLAGRQQRRRDAARTALTRALVKRSASPGDDTADGLAADLRPLSRGEGARLFAELAPHVKGADQAWLAERAREIGVIAHAARLATSRFWWRRLRGVRTLAVLGVDSADSLRLAADPHPLVRSQVAEWAGTDPSPEGVRTLAGMLSDPSRASRFAVQDALVRVGGGAVDAVAGKLRAPRDRQEAVAALRVARGLAHVALTGPVLDLSRHEDAVIRTPAYAALGALGGAAAVARLEEGLDDPGDAPRAAAAEALGRLGHWRAAAALARQLEHPAWDVRAAAARALLALGPPGVIFLRRALKRDDRFARDMARHVLEVAEVVGRRRVPA